MKNLFYRTAKSLFIFLNAFLAVKPLKRLVTMIITILCFVAPFKLFAQPFIMGVSPASGPVGTQVTISADNINATAANNIVFFGATRAAVTSVTTYSLIVSVPIGATYAPITILNTANGLTTAGAYFLPTFSSNPDSIAVKYFEPKTDFTAGATPQSVAIGDIDGDGKPDLVIANYSDNTVSVLLNACYTTGNISYAAKVDLATGTNPVAVALGDIDGDGKLDIVVANAGSNTVSVLRNTTISPDPGLHGTVSTGKVSFAAKMDFTTGTTPRSIAIGDIDGGGMLDLAVANYGSNTVSVLLNTSSPGNINFAAKMDMVTGSGPVSVAIGDIDNDYRPDLAVANSNSNTVSVLQNTGVPGNLSFAAKRDLITGLFPCFVAYSKLGGVNPTLIVANYNDNTVSVLENAARPDSISFNPKIDYPTGKNPVSVAIGDMTGDGSIELVVANYGSNSVSVLPYTHIVGAASFTTELELPTGTSPISVTVGDLDGDGKPDIVTADNGSNSVSVLRNNPVFPPDIAITSFAPTSGPPGTSVTITGNFFNPVPANDIVFFGAARATVTAASATRLTVTVPTGATYAAISVLNMHNSLSGSSIGWFLPTFTPNKGTITAANMAPKVDIPIGYLPLSVTMGDIDGDGKPDVVITNSTENTVSVYRNIGSPGNISFAPKVDLITGLNPVSVTIADINRDGKPDIVVANGTDHSVSILRNTSSPGNISFDPKVDYGARAFNPTSVVTGDFDGDGRVDIAVSAAGDYSPTVNIMLGTGSPGHIGFNNSAFRIIPYDVGPLVVYDINGDGKPDLFVPSLNHVSIITNLSNPGHLNFSPTYLPLGSNVNAASMAIGDIDGDGKPDMVMGDIANNTVVILLNTSSAGVLSFAPLANQVQVATGSKPNSITIGDMDGDGKPDVITTNYNSNTVSVLRNTSSPGSVSFAARVDLAVGANPDALVIGDLDGDGKPDAGVLNYTNNTFSVFRNNPLYAPKTQATNVVFTNTTATTTTASWTNGNGDSRAVFMFAGSTGSPSPVSLTAYNANPVFGTGDQIGSSGWYCVYNGKGRSVNITGLAPLSTYRLMTVEYNGPGSNPAWLTTGSTDNPNNVTTRVGLSNLAISKGTLSPSFAAATTNYTATVATTITSIALTPTASDGTSTVKVNGVTVASGTASPGIPLNVGLNTILIEVTAPDGSVTGTYTLKVGRGASNANLSNLKINPGTLSPLFNYTTTAYTLSVTNATPSITVVPVARDSTASVTINGTTVAPGTASTRIPLNSGANNIYILVTAQDGITTKTYTLTVNKAFSANADLGGLTLPRLTPAFTPTTQQYQDTVGYATTSITFTPTTAVPSATLTVNGIRWASGTPLTFLLALRYNTFTIVVTAEDGVTAKTYTLIVLRRLPGNANLKNIAISKGTLNTAFDANTNYYTANVGYTTTSITVIPTTSNSYSTIAISDSVDNAAYINNDKVKSGSPSMDIPLLVGNHNAITIKVTALNGTINIYHLLVNRAQSPDPSLADLGALMGTSFNVFPYFSPEIAEYNDRVANNIRLVAVTPVAAAVGATITVNGIPVTSGTSSGPISLKPRTNSILIIVTSQDNTTTKTYRVTITKATSDFAILTGLTITPGTLSPAVGAYTFYYTAAIAKGVTSVTVTPQSYDPDAAITVNGSPTASSIPSISQPLAAGPNTINVVVTATDGVTTNTYTIEVTRPPSSNANINHLVLSSGTLSPSFTQAVTSYTASVANNVSAITLTSTTTDPNATVTINGAPILGTASAPIALNVGSNVITMVGTAQDGVTTKTYTITVTRAAASLNSVYQPISVSNPVDKPQIIGEEITVHQGVSPNGDGVNDFLLIEGITNYPDNTLTIMNRAGQVVFEAKNYDNSTKVFDGHSTKTGAMQLPGTYFYSLDYNVKGLVKHKTGYIVLKY